MSKSQQKVPGARHGQKLLKELSGPEEDRIVAALAQVFSIATAEELLHFELDHPYVLEKHFSDSIAHLSKLIRKSLKATNRHTIKGMRRKKSSFPASGALIWGPCVVSQRLKKHLIHEEE